MRLNCHLRAIRHARGRSLRAVAIETGLSRGQLSEIENGRRLPPDEWLDDLERVYGRPAHEWYGRRTLLAIQADQLTENGAPSR